MNTFPQRYPEMILFLLAIMATSLPFPAAGSSFAGLQKSVVKIYATIQREDYAQPWQASGIASGSGSGFVIEKRRIITNAHVVSDARFLEVQREGDPNKYPAEIEFIAHDCDLAILTVSDPAFFENTRALAFGSQLPDLNDEAVVLGYPMGGTRLSVTRGVVSRIDYSLYTHSGADSHLVLQVDAAINPGNSGGPVMFKDKVVGLAFQGIMESQNIGYAIPLPVIRHFLKDIEDGVYQGYPELGVAWLDTRNPALRRDLQLAEKQTGVVLFVIDPFGSADGFLQPRDVLLNIDGHPVANDGTIVLDGNTVEFTELMERKQWGETIDFEIWRQGKSRRLAIPLKNPVDPFCYRYLYDHRPEYLMIQGLVFAPLTRNALATLGNGLNNRKTQPLLYFSEFAKLDGQYLDRTQFVVLFGRLTHPVNTYQQEYTYGIVAEANHRPVGSLRDLQKALRHPEKGFHIIRFEGSDNPMVLSAALTEQADREIAQKYHVPALSHFDD